MLTGVIYGVPSPIVIFTDSWPRTAIVVVGLLHKNIPVSTLIWILNIQFTVKIAYNRGFHMLFEQLNNSYYIHHIAHYSTFVAVYFLFLRPPHVHSNLYCSRLFMQAPLSSCSSSCDCYCHYYRHYHHQHVIITTVYTQNNKHDIVER